MLRLAKLADGISVTNYVPPAVFDGLPDVRSVEMLECCELLSPQGNAPVKMRREENFRINSTMQIEILSLQNISMSRLELIKRHGKGEYIVNSLRVSKLCLPMKPFRLPRSN